MLAIEARGLTKVFRSYERRPGFWGGVRDLIDRRHREVVAVAGIDLAVAEGEIVGYIGPNGAGKSTTIKMLTGILRPTSGVVRVHGCDPHRERQRFVTMIGAVFGQRSQLWWDLAVQESFALLAELYRVPRRVAEQRLAEYESVLGLREIMATPVRKLSLGQRMRADIAAALLHAPRVLFLDEPTVGLDVVTKAKLRDFLRELNRRERTTIILTTHDLQDIEALCPRVVVIDHGRVIHDGTIEALRTRFGGGKRLRVTLRAPVAELPAIPGIKAWHRSDDQLHAVGDVAPDADVPATLAACLAQLPIDDLRLDEPDIEEVVRILYGDRSG
ncbi:MAG: ATP-binding cassette domain-containing protein [Planctomycetota bacterium]|nr:ATP-binding cassette domain-containing protein [Planctomycetota bacterium]MCX8039497.1 ATP-binding cassette domain-containing protein [Planctomycetota bacterium]MDW8373015.1 ATP-binding cassette domain-containing protein [Planctomycetota bacterium]